MKKKKNEIKKKKDGIYIYNESNDLVCIIDEESDYILGREYGYINTNKLTGYSTINKNNKPKSIHALLYWDLNPLNNKQDRKWVIDHINGYKIDNRISNLQYITQEENCNKVSVHKEKMNEELYNQK